MLDKMYADKKRPYNIALLTTSNSKGFNPSIACPDIKKIKDARAEPVLLKEAIGTRPNMLRVLEKTWSEVTIVTGIIETKMLAYNIGVLKDDK
jgi:hypothetical protein